MDQPPHRLGARAYRVQASFLPQKYTVMDRVKQLDGLPAIDLTQPTVLEKGAVYVIELMESLQLTSGTEATANPKSSTGRLDVLTRLDVGRALGEADLDLEVREFLEDRLKSVQVDLESAEKEFSQFASKTGAIDIKIKDSVGEVMTLRLAIIVDSDTAPTAAGAGA